MIKFKLSDGRIEIFNLKNYEREKALYCAWYSMQGDPNFKDKLFRVMTDIGEKLEFRLGQISECIFEESLYVRIKPTDFRKK
jgi:hypothetical protein